MLVFVSCRGRWVTEEILENRYLYNDLWCKIAICVENKKIKILIYVEIGVWKIWICVMYNNRERNTYAQKSS